MAKPAATSPATPKRRRRAQTRQEEPGAVGPGNPPVHSRFRPGQSGNPAGRPRKERNLLKLIEIELDAEISVTENGEGQRITKREALAKRMVNSALQGDAKAIGSLVRLLGSGSDTDQVDMVSVDPAIIASFLTRRGTDGGERS